MKIAPTEKPDPSKNDPAPDVCVCTPVCFPTNTIWRRRECRGRRARAWRSQQQCAGSAARALQRNVAVGGASALGDIRRMADCGCRRQGDDQRHRHSQIAPKRPLIICPQCPGHELRKARHGHWRCNAGLTSKLTTSVCSLRAMECKVSHKHACTRTNLLDHLYTHSRPCAYLQSWLG